MKKMLVLFVLLIGLVLVGCNSDKLEASLTVSTTQITLKEGETRRISKTLTNVTGNPEVTYTIDNPEVASVANDGTVTALKVGSATITLSVAGYSNLTASINVTVEQYAASEQLSISGPNTVTVNGSIQLVATDILDINNEGVKWESLTPNVATVDDNGKVTGVSVGMATIKITSKQNDNSITKQLAVSKATVDSIDIESTIVERKVKTSANLKLSALVYPENASQEVIWTSNNELVATIDENGQVTVSPYGVTTKGSNEVTFTATSSSNGNVSANITFEFYWDPMDAIEYIAVLNPIVQDVKAVGYQFEYNVKVLGSVTNFYFGNYEAVEKLAPETNENRPGTKKTSVEYITVHDTASSVASATAAAHASYVYNGGGGTSWHYSIGNDGVWHQIPDDEVAWHAGDSKAGAFALYDSGVFATTTLTPEVTIDATGYYCLNGEKTSIKAPTDNGRILKTSDINDDGIRVSIGDNGNWYIGKTWWSSSYKKIGNAGGNNNSIGIETMVNQGSDLYLTWHYTAKKVAELLIENNLGLDRVKSHHFFSGKNCPQTMRDNGLYDNFLKMVEAEYLIKTVLKDYTITFTSYNTDLVNNTGHLKKLPDTETAVKYSITIKDSQGNEQTKEFTSIIPNE